MTPYNLIKGYVSINEKRRLRAVYEITTQVIVYSSEVVSAVFKTKDRPHSFLLDSFFRQMHSAYAARNMPQTL